MIREKIRIFLERHDLLKSNNCFVIGFSGGWDSVCLLDNLNEFSKKYGFKLVAAHLNHSWRGDESKQEEKNARRFCFEKSTEFYSECLPENLPHTELEARNQRYEFFNRAAKKYNATGIFTGHTESDQVETILYRIIKGTGVIGLRGIPEIRHQENYPPIYRPMLDISRKEVIEYCKNNNLSANDDSSNLNQDYLRNKIRHSLLPELKNYNEKIDRSFLRLSEVCKDTEEIVEEYLQNIKSKIYNDDEILVQEFGHLSKAAKRRIILDLLDKNHLNYSFDRIDEIIDFINDSLNLKSGNTLSIGENLWIFASSSRIKFIHSIRSAVVKSCITVNREGSTFFSELGKTLTIKRWSDDKPFNFPEDKANEAFVNLNAVQETLFLRTRKSGDRIQPFGMKEKVKLKDYLINRGIPEFERDSIPLLTTETEVLWVMGVGMSEVLRVKNKPSHTLKLE